MYSSEHFETLSIASFGASTLPRQQPFRPRDHDKVFDTDDSIKNFYQTKITNYIDDIDGATVKNKYQRFLNKTLPASLHDDNSLNFISPTKRILNNRRQVRDIMNIDDIEGTRMKVVKGIVTTNRHINPLEPIYDLPKYVEPIVPPPKFLRDTLDIKDIKGCTPKSFNVSQPRDPYQIDDIEGTRSKTKYPWHTRDVMKQDIAKNSRVLNRFQDRTDRHSDLNEPTYEVFGRVIGDNPKYTKPKQSKPYIADNHHLQTKDIPGAFAGWHNPEYKEITEIKDVTNTRDIEGAQADTVIKYMQTNRCVNPNNPSYQALDGEGVLPPVNVSLLPPELFEKEIKPAFRVTRNTGPESNAPYVYSDGTTSLNHHFPNLKYDDISFGNSLKVFDHHFSIPEDVNKVSTFNIYDKKYHRNAMGEERIASADAGVSDLMSAGAAGTGILSRKSNSASLLGNSTRLASGSHSANVSGKEKTPAAEELASIPTTQFGSKLHTTQAERQAISKKVLTTKDNTNIPEVAGTPANLDFSKDKTLDMITKRVLSDTAMTSPPINKNFVRPKNHIADVDMSNSKMNSGMTYKQRRAQSELQAEIAEVRKLVVPDVEPPPPPPAPVVEPAAVKGKKAPPAAKPPAAKKK